MNSRTILQSLPIGVVTLSEGTIEYANPAFTRLLGRPLGEVMGERLDSFFPLEVKNLIADVGFPAVAQSGSWRAMVQVAWKGSKHRDMILELREKGLAVIGTITPVERTDDAGGGNERANAALTHASRLKDTFLANMSHDLRSPLATIMGATEALLEGIYGDLNADQQRAMTDVNETSEHLLSLINDLLDLSRVRFGQFSIEPAEFELCALVRSVASIKTSEMRTKSLQLHVHVPDHDVHIVADDRRLRQVLMNLLQNAAKFSHDGGNIYLELHADGVKREIGIAVRDEGIGIPADKLASIFEPFVQVDASMSRRHSGSGLGLSIAQRIIDLHGGIIGATSTPGGGSTFTITLPWVEPTHAVQHHIAARPPQALDMNHRSAMNEPAMEQRILFVVDDNAMQCELLKGFAARAGYRVLTFANGEECLRGLEEIWPDVMVVDIHMPVMDGLEVMRRVRDLERERGIPLGVLALTALSMPGDRELCLAAGADHYMSKPVVYREFIGIIDSVASIGRSRES